MAKLRDEVNAWMQSQNNVLRTLIAGIAAVIVLDDDIDITKYLPLAPVLAVLLLTQLLVSLRMVFRTGWSMAVHEAKINALTGDELLTHELTLWYRRIRFASRRHLWLFVWAASALGAAIHLGLVYWTMRTSELSENASTSALVWTAALVVTLLGINYVVNLCRLFEEWPDPRITAGDDLKKGLLAGEKLANDLHRLEAAWYDKDKRTFELTKHVSLAQLDPLALIRLKKTGACDVTMPEWLFDLDYPGHLRRRIKSVSVTVPCVVGPYTGVNCTLSLTNNGVRVTDGLAGGYGNPLTTGDDRFVRDSVPIQSIATSHAQNDAGVFELNFQDDRFLPFEGAGAVSQWRLDLPPESNQFDFSTISDVVLHIRYQAEAGSPALATAARANLNAVMPASGVRLLVLNHEFGTEWQRFLTPAGDIDQELSFKLDRKHLPFAARHAANVRLSRVDLIVESAHAGSFDFQLQLPGAASASNETMPRDAALAQTHHMRKEPVVPPTSALGTWNLKLKKDSDADFRSLQQSDITEAFLIVRFTTW